MANLSQERREKMLAFLETLKEQHSDDESLIALGEIERELKAKKYGLVWEEHEEAVDVKMRTHIPVFTADASKEIHADPASESYNFLLEGDNLHALRLLEKTHRGSIDLIYIDPPYNTGKKDDFIYDDSYVDSLDGFRHSKWLSFMSERLHIAKNLLSKSGCILISINDAECAQLKLLCDEIFGEQNFVSMFVWHVSGNTSNSEKINNVQEYILCYAYDKRNLLINDVVDPNTDKDSKVYKDIDNTIVKNGYKHPPSTIVLPVGFPCEVENGRIEADSNIESFMTEVKAVGYISRDMKGKYNYNYPVKMDPVIIEDYKLQHECRMFSGWSNNGKCKQFIDQGFQPVKESDGSELSFYLSKNGVIFYKKKKSTYSNIISILENMGTTQSNKFFLESLGVDFSFPKPVTLITYLLSIFSTPNATILDFFAGSGTTGQAVLELNSKEDGSNRRFILCTNNENNICEEVTYQRMRTIMTGIKKDGSEYSEGIPSNLMYFRTDFVDKESDELSDELLAHIREMIQLEHGIKIDDRKYVVILTEEEMDSFEQNIADYPDLKAVFINSDIFLSAKQQKMLNDVDSYVIPDYYFDFELREAGEIW